MQQAGLNREELVAYRQRWQAVAAVEAIERQSSTVDERWRQLNALLRLAMDLSIVPQDADITLDEGWQRWQTLYARHQVQSA